MIQVASYCRVSTDKDDQANSFEAQQRYFREYIDRQPDWELYRVYADEGITGTSTKKRVQFNRMISDAKMGKFELIITKAVPALSPGRSTARMADYTSAGPALPPPTRVCGIQIPWATPSDAISDSCSGMILRKKS